MAVNLRHSYSLFDAIEKRSKAIGNLINLERKLFGEVL